MSETKGVNTLYAEIKCPKCGQKVTQGIGFQAGALQHASYKLGEKLQWHGTTRPEQRPADGNLKTVGYFECENLHCSTWQDCYPEVQEALITIKDDVICDAKPFTHRPNEIVFDIIETDEKI